MGQQKLLLRRRPLFCLALLCLSSWTAGDLLAVGRHAAAGRPRDPCRAHAGLAHWQRGRATGRQARQGSLRLGTLRLRRSLVEQMNGAAADIERAAMKASQQMGGPGIPPILARRPPALFKWEGPISHTDTKSFVERVDAYVKHDHFAFIHTDGSCVYNAADVALLFKGLKVALIGDSLTAQVYRLFGKSLQTLGYGSLIQGPTMEYFFNMSLADSVEQMLAKQTTVRKPWREETWVLNATLHGPFEGATWSYWRAYHLAPTMRGERPEPDSLFTSHLDYVFREYDVVISNLGIHYGRTSVEDLSYDLAVLGKRMEELQRQPGKAAFFRETFPQHFFSRDGSGDYPMPADATAEETSVCYPARNKTRQLWRNEELQAEADRRNLAVQPVYWQMDMHGFHQTHLETPRRDCTHFGNMVDWWLPVMDSLYTTAAAVLCKKGLAPGHCLDLARHPAPDFNVPMFW